VASPQPLPAEIEKVNKGLFLQLYGMYKTLSSSNQKVKLKRVCSFGLCMYLLSSHRTVWPNVNVRSRKSRRHSGLGPVVKDGATERK